MGWRGLSRFPMNKQQAADFLGISARTLERAVKKSSIAARYEKGKTSDVLVFDEEELKRYKTELDKPTHLPTVDRASEAATPTNRMETPTNFANSDNGLATFGELSPESANGMGLALLQALSQLQPGAVAASQESGPPGTPPAQKLLLSLGEAQSYSGLSRANLMEAIHDESLAAKIIGRGWKIKRRDLENYVEAL